MDRVELSTDLGQEILSMAKAKGASQGDVVMVESESFFVTVRMGEVEKISQAGEKRLGVRLFLGNSSASASTSDISKKSLEKLVDDTVLMARATAQDPSGGLPAAEMLSRDIPDLDLVDTSARDIAVDDGLLERAERGGVSGLAAGGGKEQGWKDENGSHAFFASDRLVPAEIEGECVNPEWLRSRRRRHCTVVGSGAHASRTDH